MKFLLEWEIGGGERKLRKLLMMERVLEWVIGLVVELWGNWGFVGIWLIYRFEKGVDEV